MGVLSEAKEGLLPLPFITSGFPSPKLGRLFRKVRKRAEERAVVDLELNQAMMMMIRVPGAMRVLALPILGSRGRRLGSIFGSSYIFHRTAGPSGRWAGPQE